ncbi:phosphatase PAP2 family protein [Brucella endophytica]|nr:phosphatase PAP2 family protein [Brucella endophytica]
MQRLERMFDTVKANLRLAFRALAAGLRLQAPADAPSPWTRSMTVGAVVVMLVLWFLHPYDGIILRAVSASDMPGLSLLRQLTDLGRTLLYLAILFCVLIWTTGRNRQGLEARQHARIHTLESQAAFAFAAIGLSGLIVEILKVLVGRPRPALIDALGPDIIQPFHGGYFHASFPSGHSATVGAIAVILALWFPCWRLGGLIAALALAFSRVAVAAHYPTDVVAGFTIGFLATLFLARFLANRKLGFMIVPGRLLPERRRPALE